MDNYRVSQNVVKYLQLVVDRSEGQENVIYVHNEKRPKLFSTVDLSPWYPNT